MTRFRWNPLDAPARGAVDGSFRRGERAAGVGLLLLGLGAIPSLASSQPEPGAPSPGTYDHKTEIRAAGFRRSYRWHVPEGYDGRTPLPLVVAIHGAFSGAKAFEKETGFSELADREGFIVVYPNGIGLFGLLRHWNSGSCCGKALKDDIDDVGFVMTVIDQISRRLVVDRSRIYVVGYSNGGMLAHRVAAECSGMVAAAAVVAATIGGRPSAEDEEWVIPVPEAAVPLILVHGRADPDVPYDGGPAKGGMIALPVRDSVGFWVEHNGCIGDPVSENLRQGRVLREFWQRCRADAEVELVTVEGWDHEWPDTRRTNRLEPDDPLYGFGASEIIWRFLKRHRRADP